MDGPATVNESTSKLSRTSTFSDLDKDLDSLANHIDWESLEASLDNTSEGLNHLIKFHMRSAVFSFPAIWTEGNRSLDTGWKRAS